MTYSYVLAFGDSTTAGAELIENALDLDSIKKLSFSNQLADKLNIPCINFAWPGGSNDRSLRLLPEALLTYPNSLVLFTYTSFDRTEFFTLDLEMQQNDRHAGFGKCWTHVKFSKRHQELNTQYLKNFYYDPIDYNRYRTYNMMLNVQLLCQQYAKNYLQIFLYKQLISSPDYQQVIYDNIDKDHIYKFDYATEKIYWKHNNHGFGSLDHWAKSKGYSFCKHGHIGQIAHDSFANELYNKVT